MKVIDRDTTEAERDEQARMNGKCADLSLFNVCRYLGLNYDEALKDPLTAIAEARARAARDAADRALRGGLRQ